MENLFLYLSRRIDVEISNWHYKQKLFVVTLRSRKPNDFEHGVQDSVYLVLEASGLLVVYNAEMGMAYPCVNQLFV